MPMRLGDVTFAHLGKRVRLEHTGATIEGVLHSVEPNYVTDHALCDDPNTAARHLTGFTVDVGGWQRDDVPLSTVVVLSQL